MPAQIADAGTPQITGTIRGPGNVAIANALVCIDDPSGSPLCTSQTLTAANGSYAVSAPAGSYHLRVYDQAGTYVPGYWSATGYQMLQANAGVIVVTTTDVIGIDIVEPLFPYIRGTLVDENDNPIEGQTINAPLNAYDMTDASGSFDIKVWPDTDNTLTAYGELERKTAYYKAADGYTLDPAEATSIHVSSADITGIEFVQPHWPKITGHFTDAQGEPVAGLKLMFRRGSDPGASSLTDANGAYAFYAFNGGGWSISWGDDGMGEWAGETHSLGGLADATMNFVAHRLPVVSGTLTGPNGEPASGVTVTVQDSQHSPETAITDADGRFLIRYLFPPFPASVTVWFGTTSTWVGGFLGETGYERAPSTAKTFSLGIDDDLDASATIDAWVHLTGRLRLATGEVATGSVAVFGPGWSDQRIAELDGSFDFALPPGTYRLGVPGGWYGQEGFAYLRAAAAPITVGASGIDLDVTLPAGHRIKGRVTSGSTPLAGVEVDIFLEGSPLTSTVTASDGTYAANVPPGLYQVGFYDPTNTRAHGFYGQAGYTSDAAVAKDVAVGTADATAINVSLPTTRHVAGKVVDSLSGSAVRYAYVEAYVNGAFYAARNASSSAAFNVPVAPGKVTFYVYDSYSLKYAPGWRTSTGLSANHGSAVATTVGTSDVSGVTIKAPNAVLLTITNAGADSITEAIAYGGVASFDVVDEATSTHYMPLLKGTYAFWVDEADSPYNLSPDGWWTTTTMTPDYALATKKSVTASSTLASHRPVGASLTGSTSDTAAGSITGIDVQLFVNGSFYTDVVSNGGFSVDVLPGTYRIAFVDLYDEYVGGWLGAAGVVGDYASARDVTVASNEYNGSLDGTLALPSPPGTPSNVSAVPYHQSALVSFTPVITTTARPVIHYTVTASPGGRQCTATTAPGCIVTGLTNGTTYTFTVTASTIVGNGPASAASGAVTPKPVPGAPGSVFATPAAHDVAVTWAAPADNGSPITSYLVDASPGGATCTPSPTTDTMCTISGLADGKYSFAVTATNAFGVGPIGTDSVVVDNVAPIVTAPVTNLRAGLSMAGSAVPVTVSWTAADALAGLNDTTLERQYGTGAFVDQNLPSAASVGLSLTLASSASAQRFRDRAEDANGNVSGWATGPAAYVTLRQETATGTVYSGSWTTSSTSTALGGKLRSTAAKSAYVSYTFTGRGVSFVSRKGPTSGKVSVYLDGKYVGSVDLYGSPTTVRWVAWGKTNSTSAKHVLKIVNQATSGRPKLYIDGFATIR